MRIQTPTFRIARLLVLGVWCFSGAWSLAFGASSTLLVRIVPKFNSSELVFDSPSNTTAANQRISVTRLDFLLSNIAFRRADGSWLERTNEFAYISAREGRTSFQMDNIPAGNYDRVRFSIGLKPEINHKSTADYPPTHPLNPDVNGLHWGWVGGYVFLALEGNWLQSDGRQSGYSYHLANDRQLMSVELPVQLEISSPAELRLTLNVDQIFAAPNIIELNDTTASTHSRANDSLANQLHANIERAFAFEPISRSRGRAEADPTETTLHLPNVNTTHVEIAPDATPYPLTISAYFPRPALPKDNPLTDQGVALGRRLFSDPLLSINNSQSCASCHNAAKAFADDKIFSTGAEGQIGTRNAMALFNLAWKSSYFWDGRAATLREQVLQPIQNPIEMHESLTNVAAKLAANKEYPVLFARAFGKPEITADRIARALEQFLLAQVSFNSKFDRVIASKANFTAEEQRGYELFRTEYDPYHQRFGADCFHCHGGALFQSQSFANNGLDIKFADLGRFLVTGRKGDEGKFAIPSLRNVELTAPYMHDGRFQTLEAAVAHYCTGMKRSPTLDPNLAKHPDGGVPLSEADQKALVSFLKTLTDERFRGSRRDL
ncbi:MAG TPA: MbnP family protein [Verrucomicrobiae bacterium]|nr:MbnP family protein [Verrucomicrobiae bacterium]